MRRPLLSLLGVLSLLMGLGAASSALATTITLTFDEFQTGTAVTNQYENLGVLVSGATALAAAALAAPASPWPANTPPNIAYSPLGLMTFTLNSAITGNVQSVSAYLSEGVGVNVGIYAYDALGALAGWAIAPANSVNTLVSVTSTGNPIATVQIHDGRGAFFGVDTVTFTTAADVMPVANGGPTREAEVGHLVTLNGGESYDPDTPPQPSTFLWTQVSGPAVTLSGAPTARPTFTASANSPRRRCSVSKETLVADCAIR
ncbi:REJ domain-containing protein [Paraburkholderia elongata]|uniref:REJ domain-containing protein n=1 Tax=Paraburkholderia elongata TaxID=2675747 RepID=UPI001C13113D|nr:REJ domain-containing protein [Paraburkholderia elongata]